jgi:P-type Ca2+ transporter type 2C
LRDAAGGLLLPLTAIQLLWINVITNGPPALALAMDRNDGLMQQPPRDPRSPLLDAISLRFIVIAGTVSALIGVLLLIVFPRLGYGIEESRTLLFLYATISQLILVYSARRIITLPHSNIVLLLVVVACLAVQLLSVFISELRLVLGLDQIEPLALIWLTLAVLVSWAVAETLTARKAIAFHV